MEQQPPAGQGLLHGHTQTHHTR